jgi:hypothetical protein
MGTECSICLAATQYLNSDSDLIVLVFIFSALTHSSHYIYFFFLRYKCIYSNVRC